MERVDVQDLVSRIAAVLNEVSAGHTIIIERSGLPIARMEPVPRQRLDTHALAERRRSLPRIDADQRRSDLARNLDPSL